MDNCYFQKLHDDLIQQFKGRPKILVLQKALARQLDKLHAFFCELRVMRSLQNAKGRQLDGIGNIVDLSRQEALIWSNLAGQFVPMDDEMYRLYLFFKIFLNTSDSTYADIVRTLKMFWPRTPLFYSEHIEHPATMFFSTPTMPDIIDIRVLQIVTRVKAAGISLQFIIPIESEEDTGIYYATGAVKELSEFIICDEMPLDADIKSFLAFGGYLHMSQAIICDEIPLDGDIQAIHATGAYLHIGNENHCNA